MSNDLGLETSVPDWIIEHPELLKRFEGWGLDYSCGGKSLETACRERHLDPEAILARIASSLNEPL
jgi:iron-sulfur cluster repair protein YtfE (RIC family)